jgi:hypothetical protein
MKWGTDEAGGIDFTGADGSSISTNAGIMAFWMDASNEAYASVNGSLTPTSAGTWSATDYEIQRVGRNSWESLNGRLAEVIIVTADVDVDARQNVEGYLAWKWGLVDLLPNQHPYKKAAPGTPPAGTVLIVR